MNTTLTKILLTERTTDALMDVDVRRTKPRYLKQMETQKSRTKASAEVFTPSWVCNAQNNLIDEAWFGREGVFNTEGEKSWKTNRKLIEFPEGKTWVDYLKANVLEITCGEAPYLVSRYDTVSGNRIDVPDRIGLLDRKLRVVSEHAHLPRLWVMMTLEAVKSTYGYEYQEDNLWLARKNLVQSVKEHYFHKFHRRMSGEDVIMFALIVSWNIFRMDGLRMTIPHTCTSECKACKKDRKYKHLDGIHMHDGIYAKIMDWDTNETLEFRELLIKDKQPSLF